MVSQGKYVHSNSSAHDETTVSPVIDEIVISYEESQRLAQEKIDARIRLLAMPPESAQKLIEQTLYPQYWEFYSEDNIWEETIPTNYGETDP